ncbi:MAG: hypothetical protein ACFCD0_29410 [Gemmataceae bacterium]
MSYLLREIAGWLLVFLGVSMLLYTMLLLLTPNPILIQSGPLTIMGIFIFRGGIHLLKVAVAARVCKEAYDIHNQDGNPIAQKQQSNQLTSFPTKTNSK